MGRDTMRHEAYVPSLPRALNGPDASTEWINMGFWDADEQPDDGTRQHTIVPFAQACEGAQA